MNQRLNAISKLTAFSIFLLGITSLPLQAEPRERLLMDFGWKFHLGNEWGIAQNLSKAGTGRGPASRTFSDDGWRTVNLPHDWAVELPFDSHADEAHGFKAVGGGFPQNSIGWYRRTFELPKTDEGRRLWLEFDGVFRDCDVFVNGWHIAHNESGYGSFRCDITDVATYGGKNSVAVRVDATQFEGWFYEGAGIYRHVWLVKTAPLAIAPDGIFVTTEFKNNVPGPKAKVKTQTSLLNHSTNNISRVTVSQEIIGPDGKTAGHSRQFINVGDKQDLESSEAIEVSHPKLWSPETPVLYKLVTTVQDGETVLDRKETEFGFRTVAFDVNRGFLLNGKPYELKGTCNHQDHAGVGAALPDALQYFRIAKLKEMGDNGYRTSHNPPTPELLQACDHLGMLVMDEPRLLGSDTQNLGRFKRQILRDRNHPSVAIWSIANEEFTVQATPAGGRVAATVQTFVKHLDPTRPTTYAAPVGNEPAGINSVIQVRGWNYHVGKDMDAYHSQHPLQPEVGTEQGSTVSTRGIYTNDPVRGYLSAYDDNATKWSNTAEQWWSYFADRPWLSGGFVWTGFDYRGEPTPYSWPCINSHFGILDTCGFPKDNFWYYQSWWTDKPVLHLLPHWNWTGREGQEVDVRALSNCEEVELFLNGQSFGRKTMKKNSELKWMVKYAPGTLSAKGYKNGAVVAETKVETTGAPAAIELTPDRAAISADGEDASVITVSVRDAQGRTMPVASNLIHFELSGPGKIIGVGNGDPSCHEPDVFFAEASGQSVEIKKWRSKKVSGDQNAAANLALLAAEFDDSSWDKANAQSDSGPLDPNESAIYRARFEVSAGDLTNDAVQLTMGSIDNNGWVYVNGQLVGEAHDWSSAATFNVKSALHAGTNSVAVFVQNEDGPGGLNKGVHLSFTSKTTAPAWQRSVFNGLAEVIVQSSKEAGEIKLTASAEGLSPATLTLRTQPCTPRPALP